MQHPIKHFADFFGQIFDSQTILKISEVMGELALGFEFTEGAVGNSEVLLIFLVKLPSVSFGDVRGDSHRRTTHLLF